MSEEVLTVGEMIREILKGYLVEGLTYNSVRKELKDKYGKTIHERGGYTFINREMEKGYITAKRVKGHIKVYTLMPENLRNEAKTVKENLAFLKGLFEDEKVEIIGSKLTKKDFNRLELI
ncbi:MAG: hypothetical protein KGD61_11000 [Candidatus Lokiarchaeota archaeon]|nr:hypothetical protein [Candidatus Lokiarchaeota archaeon]